MHDYTTNVQEIHIIMEKILLEVDVKAVLNNYSSDYWDYWRH